MRIRHNVGVGGSDRTLLLLTLLISVGSLSACSRRVTTPVAARSTKAPNNTPGPQGKTGSPTTTRTIAMTDRAPPQRVGERVRELHEAASGVAGSVLNVQVEKEVYRVTIAANDRGQTRMETALVSRTGEFLLESPIRLQEQLRILRADKRFASCLKKAGVQLLGTRKDKGSKTQYEQIGQFAQRLFVDCNGDGQALCKRVGVQAVPSLLVANQLIPGIKTTAWLESFTGCKAAR